MTKGETSYFDIKDYSEHELLVISTFMANTVLDTETSPNCNEKYRLIESITNFNDLSY